MLDLTTPIIPYEGTGIFKLNAHYNDFKKLLEVEKISYNEEVRKYGDKSPQWNILWIYDDGENEVMEFFFAKGRLFKIILKGNFKGNLPNGVNLDTTIDDAKKMDSTLKFNDWEEIFESQNGYWVDYDEETKKLSWITIFIPAAESDDFYNYNW